MDRIKVPWNLDRMRTAPAQTWFVGPLFCVLTFVGNKEMNE